MYAQQQTWNSIEVAGVRTIFYLGGYETTRLIGNVLQLSCPDTYNEMHWKLKQALHFVLPSDFDFVARTNASSYVNKKALANLCEHLPKQRFYGGPNLGPTTWAPKGTLHVNGAGIIMSKDICKIVADALSYNHTPSVEDGEIALQLSKRGIRPTLVGKSLESSQIHLAHSEVFLYRCKEVTRGNRDGNYEERCFRTLLQKLEHK
jgi:hypothetical protein